MFIASAASSSIALRNRAVGAGNVATELLAYELPERLRCLRDEELVGDGPNEESSTSVIDQWLQSDDGPLPGVKLLNLRTTAALRSMNQCPALLAMGLGTQRVRACRAAWRWSPIHQRVFVIRRRLDDDTLRELPIVIWHYFSVPETGRSDGDFAKRYAVGCPFIHVDARLVDKAAAPAVSDLAPCVSLPPSISISADGAAGAASTTQMTVAIPVSDSPVSSVAAAESWESASTKRRRVSTSTYAIGGESVEAAVAPLPVDDSVVDLTRDVIQDVIDLTAIDEEDAAREVIDLQGGLDIVIVR